MSEKPTKLDVAPKGKGLMKGVSTSYRVNNGPKFGCQIFCNNIRQARILAKIRGLDEVIDSSLMNSLEPYENFAKLNRKEFAKKSIEILHQIEFFSYIAIKSELFTFDEIHNDKGIVHELLHYFQVNSEKDIDLMLPSFKDVIILLESFYKELKTVGIRVK